MGQLVYPDCEMIYSGSGNKKTLQAEYHGFSLCKGVSLRGATLLCTSLWTFTVPFRRGLFPLDSARGFFSRLRCVCSILAFMFGLYHTFRIAQINAVVEYIVMHS